MSGDHIYNCQECEKNPYFYDALGHSGRPQAMWLQNLVTGKDLELCPRMMLLRADPELLHEIATHRDDLYPIYRAGHLPRAGGVLEQDARTLAYFRFIDSTREAAQAAYDKIILEDAKQASQTASDHPRQ